MGKVVTIVLLLALAGCASAGRHFEWEAARQVKVGMTEPELIAIMGKPSTVVNRGDVQVMGWVYVHSLTGNRTVTFPLKDGKVTAVPNLTAFE